MHYQGLYSRAIGRVAELNGRYYHENWGFGLFFEAMVATDLSDFLKRYDPLRDGFWTASSRGRVEGHITIDGVNSETKGAHLRYFIVSDELRGTGIGRELITRAVAFCCESDTRRCISGPSRGSMPPVIFMRGQDSGLSRCRGARDGERKSQNNGSSSISHKGKAMASTKRFR